MSSDFSTATRVLSISLFVAAVVLLIAMTYVQSGSVPEPMEIATRTIAIIAGMFMAPILIAFGFKSWYFGSRPELPAWRNGLALSSLVLATLGWVTPFLVTTVSVNPELRGRFLNVDPLSIYATVLYSSLLGGLLALALKGRARLLVISAVLLLWASFEASIYI